MSNNTPGKQKQGGVYVHRLETNLKGSREVFLSPLTLIVGKNGSGKSALVDSLSLALTGQARTPGLGKDPKVLLGMKPLGEDALRITATLSDRQRVTWYCSGGRAEHGGVALHAGMVTDALAGLLLGSGKAVTRAVVRAVGGEISKEKLLSEVPKALHPLLRRQLPEVADEEDGGAAGRVVDSLRVIEAAEATAKLRRELSQRIKEEETRREVLPLSGEELKELRKLEEQLPLWEELAELLTEKGVGWGEAVGAIHEEAMSVAEVLSSGGAEGKETSQEVIERLEKVSGFFQLVGEVKERTLELTSRTRIRCPTCGTPDILRDAFLPGQEGERESQTRNQLEEAKRTRARQETARCRLQRLRSMRQLLQEESCTGSMTERLRHVRDRMTTLSKRQEVASSGEGSVGVLQQLQRESAEAETLTTTFDWLVAEVADNAAMIVERRMNRRLPTTIRVKLRRQGKQDMVVEANLRKEGKRHFRALSGAERASVATAFASAVIPRSAPPVRLVLLDEVSLDGTTLKSLMRAFSRNSEDLMGVQVVITALSLSGKVPEGWNVIKLGELGELGEKDQDEGKEDEDGSVNG